MFSPGLLDGNPPPRWGAPGEDQVAASRSGKRGSLAIEVVWPSCHI